MKTENVNNSFFPERDIKTLSSPSICFCVLYLVLDINTCFTIYPFLCLYNSTILLLSFLIGQLIPTVHFRYQIVKYLMLTFYGFSCLLCILQILRNTYAWGCMCERECSIIVYSLSVAVRHSGERDERRHKGKQALVESALWVWVCPA